MGHVRPRKIPSLLDTRLLALFFVLTIAVELGKDPDLFDRLVAEVVRSVRGARSLAAAMIGVTALLAALLKNDVALLLVVPFTMLFRKVTDLDLAPVIVLEIVAANQPILAPVSPDFLPLARRAAALLPGGRHPRHPIIPRRPWPTT
jgi:Na+/H+ antiporter NhaD/arsenite permease-like protein